MFDQVTNGDTSVSLRDERDTSVSLRDEAGRLAKAFVLVLLCAAAFVGAAAFAKTVPLPKAQLTPGAADARLTAAKLCAAQFTTRDERHVTQATKRRVCAAYGIRTGCPGRAYEIDHLISIELGGAESPENLWPQPADAIDVIGFRTKDKVENAAHRAVCAGRISLEDAQQGIRGNWYEWALKKGLLKPAAR